MKKLDGKFIVTSDNLTIVFDGKTYVFEVPNNLGVVVRLMKENKFQKAIDSINKKLLINEVSGGLIKETKDGKYKIGKQIVPDSIQKLIDKVVSEKKPVDCIVALWKRINKAPDTNYGKISKESMFDYLINQCVKITESGAFIAYKKVRSDYKDCHSGRFNNTPGNEVSMPRTAVTIDRDQTCSSGLHVGAWEYVHNFSGEKIVECLVFPEDVVSVPHDYNNQKMRVCRYKVIRDVTEFSSNPSILLGTSTIYDVEEESEKKVKPIVKKESEPKSNEKIKISRVSEDRLPISKAMLTNIGLISGSKVGVWFDGKNIVVEKISKLAEFELTVNKDGSMRLSKTIVDRITKKDHCFIQYMKEKNGKKKLVISAK